MQDYRVNNEISQFLLDRIHADRILRTLSSGATALSGPNQYTIITVMVSNLRAPLGRILSLQPDYKIFCLSEGHQFIYLSENFPCKIINQSYSGVLTSSPICLTLVRTLETIFNNMISKLNGFPFCKTLPQTLPRPWFCGRYIDIILHKFQNSSWAMFRVLAFLRSMETMSRCSKYLLKFESEINQKFTVFICSNICEL